MTSSAESINREAKYIIRRAQMNDIRIVAIGVLLFFSTAVGDAWVLDTEDSLALCLALEGEEQPFYIGKRKQAFEIEWKGSYLFDGDTFIFNSNTGDILKVDGYPLSTGQKSDNNLKFFDFLV